MPAPTWVAGLFDRGDPDELAEAERRVAILKAELEAIRGGRKEASAAELRKLDRDYRDAVSKVQQLRVAARPTPSAGRMRLPMIAKRGPTMPEVAPRGVTTPRGYTARVGAPPTGGVGAVPGGALGITSRRGYATPTAGPTAAAGAGIEGLGQMLQGAGPPTGGGGVAGLIQNLLRGGGPAQQIPAAGTQTFGPSISGLPGYARDVLSGRTVPGLGGGAPVGRRAAGYTSAAGGGAGVAGEMTYEQLLALEGQMTQYQAGSLEQRRAEAQALQAYRMAQLGQGQQQMGATAAYRQQQAEHAQAQLKQAWMVAQAELAHAQNVMASQIGTSLSQQQGQMWAQGLPYALPQGTQVAPGFERGGPMQQLHRMSGAQFTPGRTGRISPQPAPSQQQMMQWVQQAMGQFGAGR